MQFILANNGHLSFVHTIDTWKCVLTSRRHDKESIDILSRLECVRYRHDLTFTT